MTYAVVTFVILQVAQLLADGLDLPSWVFRSVTFVSLIGFPVALLLAWALEVTPEGIKRTQDPTPGELAANSGRSSWTTAALAITAVLIMLAAGWWNLSATATTYDSIAVLPFANLSADSGNEDNEYLGDGLAEELINALGNVSALKVAARTSAFSFKGRDVDIRSIGEQLGVVSVLEGSVRRDGNQVRVSAQLVDAGTGFSIWRGNYGRAMVDLYALQNEIAGEIVNALAVELGASNADQLSVGGSENGEAYELYVRARQRWATRDMDELRQALDEMRTATELDPGFALAWSGLSDVIDALAWRSPEYLSLVPEAKSAALRALALGPEAPEAWASLGIITAEFDHQWYVGLKLLERAVSIRPSYAQAHLWQADILRYLGRFDEALQSLATVYQLDPLSNFFKQNYAYQLIHFGDPVEGEKMLREVVAELPDHINALAGLAFNPSMAIPQDERAEFAERWATAMGYSTPARARIIAEALVDAQKRPEALFVLQEIASECAWSNRYSRIAAMLGDRELTLSMLELGIQDGQASVIGAGVTPLFAFIADDPRFMALVEQFNLPVIMP
jgi:TolB-like protein